MTARRWGVILLVALAVSLVGCGGEYPPPMAEHHGRIQLWSGGTQVAEYGFTAILVEPDGRIWFQDDAGNPHEWRGSYLITELEGQP